MPVSSSTPGREPTSSHFRQFNNANAPITAPSHSWLTSPARSHAQPGHGKELPLHLIQVILQYLDDIADLARITRTSRMFYYMTLPRLYENVTLRSYREIRYVDNQPVGFGGPSPFAMGLNTLVSRMFSEYVNKFRMVGEWQEHDVEDYSKGRVPDNSMMLQIVTRAALDKMTKLSSFAWELNTKPLQTVYEGLMHKSSLTSLTLRCPSIRIPRPTTVVPPLPNLNSLIVYDIDPLCYPDNISLLLLTSKKLENLKLHFHPRMREAAEESVNLLNFFGRCIAAKHSIPLKRFAMYNLYARNQGEGIETVTDHSKLQEITMINSMGTANPVNVFLDDTWRVPKEPPPVPHNLKTIRMDHTDKEHVRMMYRFHGLERLYLVGHSQTVYPHSKNASTAQTPTPTSTSPSTTTTPGAHTNSALPPANGNTTASTPTSAFPTNGIPLITETQCKTLGGDYLAAIQSNHGRTIRHLLLPDHWQLSPTALIALCQACPNLEQLGFSSTLALNEAIREIVTLCPKIWALRVLAPRDSKLAEHIETFDKELHRFMLAQELWRPEYRGLKYLGVGELVCKLGRVFLPPPPGKIMMSPAAAAARLQQQGRDGEVPGAETETDIDMDLQRDTESSPASNNVEGSKAKMGPRKMGPMRKVDIMDRKSVEWIEIWGLDSCEFEPRF